MVRECVLEMVMVVMVLKEEERASRETFLYFSLFFGTLVPHCCTSFDIYSSSFFDIVLVSCGCVLGVLSFSSSFLLHSEKKKKLLYLILGPLSFDKFP